MLELGLFYTSATVALVATAFAVTRYNVAHALIYLIISLLASAVIFYLVGAPFADKVHGTPLAQHASGCLFFTFITGKDPRENDHVDLHAEARFPDKQLSPEQAKWLRERVWSLYQQQIAKKL